MSRIDDHKARQAAKKALRADPAAATRRLEGLNAAAQERHLTRVQRMHGTEAAAIEKAGHARQVAFKEFLDAQTDYLGLKNRNDRMTRPGGPRAKVEPCNDDVYDLPVAL